MGLRTFFRQVKNAVKATKEEEKHELSEIERQKREAKEDLKREKELVKALGDGSRNWRPDAESRFGSKPDTHAFLPKTKRTTGGE